LEKICPRCNRDPLKDPIGHNAISRTDKKTWICSNCGIQETFIDYLLTKNYLEDITEEMKKNEKRLADRLGLKPII